MPKKIAPHPQIAGFEKLEVFTELVHGSLQSLRNHLNESQLSGWLEEIVSDKLGPLVEAVRVRRSQFYPAFDDEQ